MARKSPSGTGDDGNFQWRNAMQQVEQEVGIIIPTGPLGGILAFVAGGFDEDFVQPGVWGWPVPFDGELINPRVTVTNFGNGGGVFEVSDEQVWQLLVFQDLAAAIASTFQTTNALMDARVAMEFVLPAGMELTAGDGSFPAPATITRDFDVETFERSVGKGNLLLWRAQPIGDMQGAGLDIVMDVRMGLE